MTILASRMFEFELVDAPFRILVATILVPKLFDRERTDEFKWDLTTAIDEKNRVALLLDFSAVEFVSSPYIPALIAVHKHLKLKSNTHGSIPFVFCRMRREISEVFRITRLSELFPICETREQALAQIKQ